MHIRQLEAAGHSSVPEGARVKVRNRPGSEGMTNRTPGRDRPGAPVVAAAAFQYAAVFSSVLAATA